MKIDIKNIAVIFLISIFMVYTGHLINSGSVFLYINNNLITVLLAFLAINTATLGHLAAKIQDVMVLYKALDFSGTIKEMKKSLFEQIVLISMSILLLMIRDSSIYFSMKDEILNVFSFSIFLYAIQVLWDTGKSVFVIIEEMRKLK